MTWTRVPAGQAEASWDAQLARFAGHSLYQSFPWGQYKRVRGWTPHHFEAAVDSVAAGMLQALVRAYPLGAVVAWCPGGPVGALELCGRESMRQLASLLNARVLYCRSTLFRVRTPEDDRYLASQGWSRPARTLGANTTAVWNLSQSEEQLLAGLNRNWRYSLRQAQKSDLVVEQLVNPPIDELAALCRAMNASKGVPAPVRRAEIAALFEALDGRILLYGCRNTRGELVAFHSCGLHGERAWELLAATSPEGRRLGASFAALWRLVQHCRRLQVTHYDLAGIDPVHAPGVASFKRWTGAEDVEWLGEWQWSTPAGVRHLVDLVARNRAAAALP